MGPNAFGLLPEALRLFWSAVDPYAKRQLMLAWLVVAASAALAALVPIALKLLIDRLSHTTTTTELHLTSAALVLLYVSGLMLVKLLTELRALAHGLAEQRVQRRIGLRLFDQLVHLPLRFHLERQTGAMGETAEQGIRGYQLLLTHAVYTFLPAIVELLVVAVVLLYLGHTVYLVILGLASLAYLVAFHRGATGIQEPARAVSASHIEKHAVLTDSLLNFETVKYFAAERVTCDRYDAALARTEMAWRQFFQVRIVNGLAVVTIFAFSLGASLMYALGDVARGTMTVGDFVLVNAYVIRLAQPLELLGFAVRDVMQGLGFLLKLLELFREPREEGHSEGLEQERSSSMSRPSESNGPNRANGSNRTNGLNGSNGSSAPTGVALEFESVSFSYQQPYAVVKEVSFRVLSGRTVAVVGVSGSGKSSLIRLLFRLYEPDAGRILLYGVPIAELPVSEVRRAIAVVPQDTVLFNDSIANNIGMGRVGSGHAEIVQAAQAAHLHDFIMGLSEGYETVVGERGLKLSGGERQRIAIARAVLKQPRIYIFDEATSSLDSRTERQILRNLADVANDRTTLVIAHRLSTVVHADEILVLDDGMIVERGTHRELRRRGGYYATLWRAQHAYASHETGGIGLH